MEKASPQGKPEVLFELTNEIPELVYIADIETYELLFINKAGKDDLQLVGAEGQKCYKMLQGLDAPCSFCTNDRLSLNETYTWMHDNPISNRHYLLKDKLILWEGRKARLEVAFDITQQEDERQALSTALDAERVMMDCVRELYDAADPHDAVNNMLRQVGEFLSADRAYLFEIQGNKMYNTLEWCANGVQPEQQHLQGLDIRLIDRWQPYFVKRQCVVVEDVETLRESSPDEYQILTMQGIDSMVAMPLERDGELGGYIGVDNPDSDRILNIVPLFQTLRYFIMASFRRAENEERLVRLSYYDTLTGLYNRNRFMLDTQDAGIVSNVGVVQLDVNGLKTVNDRQGHAVGDGILAECARRMGQCFSHADFYRVGGDEFVVICRGMLREEFEACVRELQEQMAVNEVCSAAIGADWTEHAVGLQSLLMEASARMYNDKKRFYRMTLSSDRYRHYNDDVLGLTNPDFLKQELARGSFLVYYQPKVSFQTRGIVGAEALVRYQMEDGAIISPQQFVPILEDARMMTEVDFYMFKSVCENISMWREKGYRIFPVAVNFSRYSLMEMDFISRLETCCRKYGVGKSLVEIEITESVEGVDGFDVKQRLSEIRRAGFLVSIDDFGARYANLYLFASTRFDVLKIDKSLVDDIVINENVVMMLEAVNSFCEKLRVETVAEGVETEEQFRLLRSIGIKQAQGFLFSHPLPIAEYEQRYLTCTVSV